MAGTQVNLWVTPESANLEPDTGGLRDFKGFILLCAELERSRL